MTKRVSQGANGTRKKGLDLSKWRHWWHRTHSAAAFGRVLAGVSPAAAALGTEGSCDAKLWCWTLAVPTCAPSGGLATGL
eukprot:2979801-Pleurochrysis_carterae.AAC.1